MSSPYRPAGVLLALALLAACTSPAPQPAAESAASTASPAVGGATRARDGDTVLVVATPIRADRRADFDALVDTIWSAGLRSEREGWSHVRVLRPTDPNPDGTFTYFIVFDPMQPGGDPGLEAALRKLFPEPQVKRLIGVFDGAAAAPQTAWRVVQTRY
jgi:hypothetical protein